MFSIAKVFIVIAAALVIASGIWVAAALLRTLIHSSPDPNAKPAEKLLERIEAENVKLEGMEKAKKKGER